MLQNPGSINDGFRRPADRRATAAALAAGMHMRVDGGPDRGHCPPSVNAAAPGVTDD